LHTPCENLASSPEGGQSGESPISSSIIGLH
jgi:hypothetical protein